MSVARPAPDPSAANRGAPARIAPDGSVAGSGAGAGGGGAPEDFDADSTGGGGGDVQPRTERDPMTGGDAPSHGSA